MKKLIILIVLIAGALLVVWLKFPQIFCGNCQLDNSDTTQTPQTAITSETGESTLEKTLSNDSFVADGPAINRAVLNDELNRFISAIYGDGQLTQEAVVHDPSANDDYLFTKAIQRVESHYKVPLPKSIYDNQLTLSEFKEIIIAEMAKKPQPNP